MSGVPQVSAVDMVLRSGVSTSGQSSGVLLSANGLTGDTYTDKPKAVAKMVEQFNRELDLSQRQIVFQFDKISHQIWLNVIDKTTGQVVAEYPPETIRRIADGYSSVAGLAIDKQT